MLLQSNIFPRMDDNAKPHRDRLVESFLNEEGIERIDWPAQSPDFHHLGSHWNINYRASQTPFNTWNLNRLEPGSPWHLISSYDKLGSWDSVVKMSLIHLEIFHHVDNISVWHTNLLILLWKKYLGIWELNSILVHVVCHSEPVCCQIKLISLNHIPCSLFIAVEYWKSKLVDRNLMKNENLILSNICVCKP